jgi:4-alpha-glucanotransferase
MIDTGSWLPPHRASGVLLHVTSLPSGRLGDHAYTFVDWLAAAGQSFWQVLPLGPPDAFGSPYTAESAFAGWAGLLAEPGAEVTTAECDDFRERHTYWISDWERYAGPGAIDEQVRFEREWLALRRYAERRGIRIIGDLPIYVASESADVVAHPELFDHSELAGAAPDASHPEGQLWGQPTYDWRAVRADGYRWWIERFRRTFELVDIARLDHFRGFVSYWAVPAGARDPLAGRWRRGPGIDLFEAVEAELGRLPLIAEDLGRITPAVDALRERLGIPGMRIVGRGLTRRHRRRHAVGAHPKEAVVYTGTHDHPTLGGWWASASKQERRYAQSDIARAGIDGEDVLSSLVHLTLSSRAQVAILPTQDILRLGGETRMNSPGTLGSHNWSWRLAEGQLTDELAEWLRNATAASGRLATTSDAQGTYASAGAAGTLSLRSVRSTSRVS